MESDPLAIGPLVIGPLVIGHRGAAGYRPEHTLGSYELAAQMGADFVEPDLVATADGVLVARHEPEIGGTTDVSGRREFADRHTTKIIDGVAHTGWFTDDFTLAELRTLRATERIPDVRHHNTRFGGEIVTFDEVLALCARLSTRLGREIGVYAEVKHPSWFAAIGLPLGPLVVRALDDAGLNTPHAPVVVESFETTFLRTVHAELHVPLTQLVDAGGAPADLVAAGDPRTYADMINAAGLAEIAGYATGIGPDKDLVIPRDAEGNLAAPTSLVADAHAAGLRVHPYTFRDEHRFLPTDLRRDGGAAAEYEAYFQAGVDGVFTDNPDTAVAARTARALRPAGP